MRRLQFLDEVIQILHVCRIAGQLIERWHHPVFLADEVFEDLLTCEFFGSHQFFLRFDYVDAGHVAGLTVSHIQSLSVCLRRCPLLFRTIAGIAETEQRNGNGAHNSNNADRLFITRFERIGKCLSTDIA